jgi:hypothetical protein
MNNAIEIRFGFFQRLRVLVGQRVHVVIEDGSPMPKYSLWVARNRDLLNCKAKAE